MSLAATEWITDFRKIDPEIWMALGVRPERTLKGSDIVSIPYHLNGEVVGSKMRVVTDKRWFSEGKGRPLYNVDSLKGAAGKTAIITEGEFDCMAVIQSGFNHVVSLPDGWTEKGNKTDAIIEAMDLLKKTDRVIVAGDNDAVGESLPRAVYNVLGDHKVFVVKWPEDCKDANDVLMVYGEAKITECINNATRIFPDGGVITGFSDLPPLGDRRVLRSNNPSASRFAAFETGAISIITGVPASGKSTFATWMFDEIALSEKIRCGFFSFETHPHRLRDQLSRKREGKPFKSLGEEGVANLLEGLDRSWALVHRTYDGDPTHGMDFITDMVRELAVFEQCKLIVIDPWNEVEHQPAQGESLTNYINVALAHIRKLAELYDIHISIVAHPRKMPTDGKKRLPSGYDIADSAAFMNKPSLGVTVGRGEMEGDVVVSVWKVRDTLLYGFDSGVTGMRFNPETGSYGHNPFYQEDAT